MAINLLYLALLILCCGYVFWKGAAPERIGMAIVVANAVLSLLAVSTRGFRFHGVEVGIFVVDVLAFFASLALALRADRFWPLWLAALLGLGILGHVARWVGPDMFWWAYAVILSIWSYPILAIIAIGTFLHQRRLKRHGVDRSWLPRRGSVPPAAPTG